MSYVNTKLLRANALRSAADGEVRLDLKLLLEVLDQHDAFAKALQSAEAPHKRGCSTPYLEFGTLCPCGVSDLLDTATLVLPK